MLKRILATLFIGSVLLAGFWYITDSSQQVDAPTTITFAADADTSEFARAAEVIAFEFPRDHGPHFDYQTEWWYYTGNLTAENGDHFGYQLTFFRRGLTPGAPVQRPSDFGTNQIYFAHFAVTDVSREQHTFAERFSRGAARLAGASRRPQGPFTVLLQNLALHA